MCVYVKSNQSMVVLFKMIISVIYVFVFSSLTLAMVDAENTSSSGGQESYCELPPYPEHGTYTVKNIIGATPGGKYPSVLLEVSCKAGFENENSSNSIFCINGDWSSSMPKCIRFCTLSNQLSVEYRCEVTGSKLPQDSRECESWVPAGTVVTPLCRSPGYFSIGVLNKMHCIDGIWDYIAICQQECGTISSQHDLVLATPSNHVEVPWHTAIYRKTVEPYQQICGGSLITATKIISAAHCFWNEAHKMLNPASNYAVTVGMLYRAFDNSRDINSQKADVVDIKVPLRFQGAATNFQNDISIVVVANPFVFHRSVRPVCLNFDYNFDKIQLAQGNIGKATGWGVKDKNKEEEGRVSKVLKVVNLQYLTIEECFKRSPPDFQNYISNDKFCAESENGTSVCLGDSGGGLAFNAASSQRYYLRGVLSLSPRNSDSFCNTFTTYTSILQHEHFIKQYLE